LKEPIKHVILNLSLETDRESKKDCKELKKRNLKTWEWDLLNQLIKVFKPIEEATEWLGGQKYCTLSLIYPTIQALKYDYISDEDLGIEETMDTDERGIEEKTDENRMEEEETGEDEVEEEETDEDGMEEEEIDMSDNEHHDLRDVSAHDDKPNINRIINLVKESIYDALFNYFDSPPDAVLIASLLDPRFKKMKGWLNNDKKKVIALLRSEYYMLKDDEISDQREVRIMNNTKNNQTSGFRSHLFGDDDEDLMDEDEVDRYLDRIRTSQANSIIDPFQWWRDHEKEFPILFKVSQKYLEIPATSVPSECLFSDAGNQITHERNCLKPDTVNELLFIKRNREYYNPYD
jgi:hypothetical protein